MFSPQNTIASLALVVALAGAADAGYFLRAEYQRPALVKQRVQTSTESSAFLQDPVFGGDNNIGFADASFEELRVFSHSRPRGNTRWRAAWFMNDVFLTPDTPGTSTTTLGLTADLHAILSGDAGPLGPFREALSQVRVEMRAVYRDANFQRIVQPRTFQWRSRVAGDELPRFFSTEIDGPVTANFTLPTGVPIAFFTELEGWTKTSLGSVSSKVDAADTLTFNTNQLFDLEDGISANAEGVLVDNAVVDSLVTRDPTVIPEPSSFTLLGIGLAGVLGYGYRRSRKASGRTAA